MLATLELYDIQNDPSELNNIAGKHPEIVKQLLMNYGDWCPFRGRKPAGLTELAALWKNGPE